LTPAAIYNLADLRHHQKRFDEAKELYQQALGRRRQLLGDNHFETLYVIHSLGILAHEHGEAEQAEAHLRQATIGYSNSYGPDHWQVGVARMHLGRSLTTLGRFADAQSELLEAERVLALAEVSSDLRHQRLCEAFVALYEAWEKAEPDKEFQERIKQWREQIPSTSLAKMSAEASDEQR
jgi:tetratricopeptide (TPR) repeat protein